VEIAAARESTEFQAAGQRCAQNPTLLVDWPGWRTAFQLTPAMVTEVPACKNAPFHRLLMVPCTVMVTCQVMAEEVLFVTVSVAQ
jgi:hypothetical protein